MPREFFRRYMPDAQKVRDSKSLRFMGHFIHDANLWHLNRHSVSRAIAVGLFWAMIPMPMQMLAAALLAIPLRANLPLSVGLVWVTNPVTMPPVFYANYRLGAWLMDTPAIQMPDKVSLNWLLEITATHWQPLYLGSLVSGIILALLGYSLTLLYWRWWVAKSWKHRQKRRRQRIINACNNATNK